MKPSCKHCGKDIEWVGFDLTKDEHVCGVCLTVRRWERERIIKLLEDMDGLDDWYQGTIDEPDGPYIDRKDAIALIKGEQK